MKARKDANGGDLVSLKFGEEKAKEWHERYLDARDWVKWHGMTPSNMRAYHHSFYVWAYWERQVQRIRQRDFDF